MDPDIFDPGNVKLFRQQYFKIEHCEALDLDRRDRHRRIRPPFPLDAAHRPIELASAKT